MTLGLFSVGLGISGVVLFLMPPGRIANWSDWTCLGLTKSQWIGLHLWLALGFLIASLLHVAYNWKHLVGYFKDKARHCLAFRWEWSVALMLFCLVCVGTVRDIPPFSNLVDWQTSIRHRYHGESVPGRGRGYRGGQTNALDSPTPSADRAKSLGGPDSQAGGFGRMTLKSYCDEFGLDVSESCVRLEAAGLKATPDMTLREVAATGSLHPSAVRRLLTP